jgi:hypothetical protein
MTTQRSYMKAFLQMSVEIATLYSICYSEKCCVKLSWFINKKTHLTGFEHRNCMYWAHLLQWDIQCVLSQSRSCHHWSCVECRYAVIRVATNTKLLRTFFGCLCPWFARHLSLQEQCFYQYDVTSHSAQQIYISHRTLCYEKPIILLVGVIWPCCQVILLGNTEQRSEMESIFLKTCLLWSLFFFWCVGWWLYCVVGNVHLLNVTEWKTEVCGGKLVPMPLYPPQIPCGMQLNQGLCSERLPELRGDHMTWEKNLKRGPANVWTFSVFVW